LSVSHGQREKFNGISSIAGQRRFWEIAVEDRRRPIVFRHE